MPKTPEPILWLSLIDVSGPFLAGTVLEEVFPQGLEKIETPRRQRLRAAYEEWRDAIDEDDPQLAELHSAWIKMVLEECLEYDKESLASRETLAGSIVYRSAEHGTVYSPDFAAGSNTNPPRLLVSVYPPGASLDNPPPGDAWSASPAERMTLLCRACECRVGLVTNGEQWMLVNAPIGETSGYASWYSRLWWQEPVTLKAFQSLLSVRRCFGPEEETLPRLLERSLEFQEEVTNTLGEQVRRAVEVLIQSLGRADQDRNGAILRDVTPAELYEAGLTVMMRLVFLLSAEERGLLLLGDPVYDQHYAVSTLRARLREDADQYGVEVLERRNDAWSRLLATFRGVYGGIEHEALRLPALGGSLFDPDRFPFLEGRTSGSTWREETATPLPIDNRTVLLLMTALQVIEQRGGAQLLSYRALDVEQIGHVYEGLLEFTAARVPEITLGLIGTKKLPNPQVTLAELDTLASQGGDALLEHLQEITGRSLPALRKAINAKESRESLISLVQATNGDESLARRLHPYAELIRADSWGNLLVYRQGSFAIVKGTDRRSSGTHYTPRSLTEPIVRYTLEPLVYIGPAEGHPQGQWKLKSSSEILALNLCDMACGSGAFLVEACRYLSARLVEAWANEEAHGLHIGIDGVAREAVTGQESLPKSLDDRLLVARRMVAQSCLYGVDVNHLAVELAKLSIWLVTLAKNKPFSFLDHSIRCGDSLVGLHSIDQLRHYSLKPDADDAVLFKGPLDSAVDEAINLRLKLEDMPANTVDDVQRQEKLLIEANEKIARLRCAADMLVAAEFWSKTAKDKLEKVRHAAVKSGHYVEKGPAEEFEQVAAKERRGQLMFHWPLEFPEVIVKRGGFDAFVGNPPFLGGMRISPVLGYEYSDYLKSSWAHCKGHADLVAYCLLRAFTLTSGALGMITTNSLCEGDTREVGLSHILKVGGSIYRAEKTKHWPGTAGVFISTVHISNRPWSATCFLDELPCEGINSRFEEGCEEGDLERLKANSNWISKGTGLVGIGFVVESSMADEWIALDEKYSDVLFPYLNAVDFNTSPDQSPTRKVINFQDWHFEQAQEYPFALDRLTELVKPVRDAITKQVHETCYWKYWDKRTRLYDDIRKCNRVLVVPVVTTYINWAFVPTNWIYSNEVYVLPSDSASYFAVLQSSIHDLWVTRNTSRLKSHLRYTTTDSFQTFPFPLEKEYAFAEQYHQLRAEIMRDRSEGLTKTYHRFHAHDECSADIQSLRSLHIEMDYAVAAAYGWTDLDLGHGLHENQQGVRFTVSESARRVILQRLLKLNHERYAEEVRLGLHQKQKRKPRARKNNQQADLFQGEDD